MKNNIPLKPMLFTFLILIVFLLPSQLQAYNIGNLNFFITNEFIYQNNKLANKNNQIYETLSLFANYNKWSVGITLRGNNFFKQNPNISLEEIETDIYRKYIQYNSKHLKVNFGDFYALLGRGLVLSILQNDDILRERTILGGDLHFNKGKFDFRILGGRLKDETQRQEWNLAGGEASLQFVKNHTLGLHLSYVDDVDTQRSLGKRLTYSASIKGNKLFKHFSYYSEMALLNFQDASRENGYGFYSNVMYNKSHVTLSMEYKRYKDFNNEINNPPIADRVDEISSINDTNGAMVLFKYAFMEPDITLFLNVGRYKEYEESGNHIYGGFEIEDFMDRLNLTASFGIRDIHYPIKRLESYLIYQFNDYLSCEMGFKNRWYEDGNFKFKEIDHNLQFSYSPYVSIFFLHQYSYNKVIDLNHFYSGGVKVYLPGGTAIEVSGGTIRGGQICSGGQCYIAPPFKGFKFSVLHTFK
jgi:Family of unknown function (DUF6029)